MKTSTRVSAVDGLRGALAAFVVFDHILNAAGDGRLNILAGQAVNVFFVISGYVLTRGWRGEYHGFLARRFVRLWPLYALSMAIGGWLACQPAPLSYYLWIPFEASKELPQNPVAWSLFVEAWVMPAMPLVIWAGRRLVTTAATIVALTIFYPWLPELHYIAFFVVGSLLSERTLSSRFLESAPLQWLGRVSYSLYLTHPLVIGVLKFNAPREWLYLAVPAILLIAQALCSAIERPSIALSRRAGRMVERALRPTTRSFAPLAEQLLPRRI